MEMRRVLSALALATSLGACKGDTPEAPMPDCPDGKQIESDFTGAFYAGGRRFDPTSNRGELKMIYGGQSTLLDAGDGIRFRSSNPRLPRFASVIDYRVVTNSTEFGTTAHVIASCVPVPTP